MHWLATSKLYLSSWHVKCHPFVIIFSVTINTPHTHPFADSDFYISPPSLCAQGNPISPFWTLLPVQGWTGQAQARPNMDSRTPNRGLSDDIIFGRIGGPPVPMHHRHKGKVLGAAMFKHCLHLQSLFHLTSHEAALESFVNFVNIIFIQCPCKFPFAIPLAHKNYHDS